MSRALAVLLLVAFLWLYNHTAAPSVLSGDSAEFQFAAPLLAVPHPTGYPLYVLLGFAAAQFPGDAARRVTQVSVACGALCVVVLFALGRRLGLGLLPSLLAALVFGLSPGLWNAATLAEVYALNMLLLATMALALAWHLGHTAESASTAPLRLGIVGLLAGLGLSHHSSFLFAAGPLVAAKALATLRQPHPWRGALALAAGGLLGLSPWLLPLLQYARFGPFSGQDYGLPLFYFWGAPTSWSEALGHLAGGALREGATQAPTAASMLATGRMVAGRMAFEFGPLGLLLGACGFAACYREHRLAWAGTLWIMLGTCTFLLLLGPRVQDAPVFTLPLVLPWALWVGWGAQALSTVPARRLGWKHSHTALLLGCLALTLTWGASRRPYADKSGLWLFRTYGEQVLGQLAPDAALLVPWEQGTTLQYLRLVEGQRPDVWVDVVEPGDEPWAERAGRYAGRPVYFLGNPAFFEGATTSEVWRHDYGSLYLFRGRR